MKVKSDPTKSTESMVDEYVLMCPQRQEIASGREKEECSIWRDS